MNIKTMLKTAATVLDDKMPVILTAVGVGGVVATAVLSAKAAVKAKEVLDQYDLKEMEPRDKREVLMDVAPAFIPAIAVGATSIACIVGAQAKNASRIALLATAYAAKDENLDDLKENVKEFFGEKKANELHAKMAEKKVEALEDDDFVGTGHGSTKFVDLVTGVKFQSDIEFVRKVINELNLALNCGETVSVADFYYDLNLIPGKMEDSIGWDATRFYKLIDVSFEAALRDDEPVISIDYDWDIIDLGILHPGH